MNKSLKFLAISLLMVPTLARAQQDDATSTWQSKGLACLYFLGTHAKQVGYGVAAGAATGLAFRGIEFGTGLNESTKGIHEAVKTNEAKLVIAAGGTVVVANTGNSWVGTNSSDELGMLTAAERTVGNVIGLHLVNKFVPRAQK